ncbi:MAG: SufD family Fe-S cluster assembly protein [Mycoplasmataceae bacterium]|jgi:Fe-S cluster assembly protein SufD|nr:SufD family Fe-S cluster assembly protein [Mycoplasmataceae bacterium]
MSKVKNFYINIAKSVHKHFNIPANVTHAMYYCVDTANRSTVSDLSFSVPANKNISIYIYAINNNFQKHFNVTLKHGSYTNSNIGFRAVVAQKANTVVNMQSVVDKNTVKVNTNQNIEGIIVGNDATIHVVPSMIIDTNRVQATHTVNIGHVNPDHLFYLMTKGVQRNLAMNLILKGLFNKLAQAQSKNSTKLYNDIQDAIHKAMP